MYTFALIDSATDYHHELEERHTVILLYSLLILLVIALFYLLCLSIREILPSMQVDPTEEQVLLALWTSLTTNNMMDGRDRRQVKCSSELKNLFGVEALSLATLRHKVSEHLLPARAIQVEYNVTNVSSSVTTR